MNTRSLSGVPARSVKATANVNLGRAIRGRRRVRHLPAWYPEQMLDWTQCSAVERVPGKVGGMWLFKATRVPVSSLFENLEGGACVAEFLEWFPGVTREQVEAVLEHAERSLAEA